MDMVMVFTDIYETEFGIYDHMATTHGGLNTRPLVSVALHEAESLGDGSDLYNFVDSYFDREVFKYTGLTLHEFGNYPSEYIHMIFRNIEKLAEKEAKSVSATDAALNNVISRGKK